MCFYLLPSLRREVTAERIRDKIAASKKKGMWMGGMVPWGYKVHSDPKIQSLEICEERSSDIRHVYDLYEQLGCLSKVKRSVDTALARSELEPWADTQHSDQSHLHR